VSGLLLAGDWVDTGLPATIEGAVRSGHWAAEAAKASLHLVGASVTKTRKPLMMYLLTSWCRVFVTPVRQLLIHAWVA